MRQVNKKNTMISVIICSLIFFYSVFPSLFSSELLFKNTEVYDQNYLLENDKLINGNFEDGLNHSGWDLKYLDPGALNINNHSSVRSFSGLNSYYIYGEAENPGPRTSVTEIAQNISILSIIDSNLTGHIYVEQCSSNASTYESWVGIYLDFYNSSLISLGKIFYQFASANQATEFPNEINLYNQLGQWLDLNRNITEDFNNLIGTNFYDVIQIELVLYVQARDGPNVTNKGYAEAYFDNFSLYLDNIIVNSDFEADFLPNGWDLTFFDPGASNIFNISTSRSYNGPSSFYMYGHAQNPGPRTAVNEISQRIFVNDFTYIILIGAIFIEQCSSISPTYTSWVGLAIDFYNSYHNNLGRIYYQFASDNQGSEFLNEINLYNQLGSWLEFQRNIVDDFNTYIGSDPNEVVEMKLNMYTLTRDGSNSGNNGYTEAYFDNFLLYQIGLSTTTETLTEVSTDLITITQSITTITTKHDVSTTTITTTTTTEQVSATNPSWTIIIFFISFISIGLFYRNRRRK